MSKKYKITVAFEVEMDTQDPDSMHMMNTCEDFYFQEVDGNKGKVFSYCTQTVEENE